MRRLASARTLLESFQTVHLTEVILKQFHFNLFGKSPPSAIKQSGSSLSLSLSSRKERLDSIERSEIISLKLECYDKQQVQSENESKLIAIRQRTQLASESHNSSSGSHRTISIPLPSGALEHPIQFDDAKSIKIQWPIDRALFCFRNAFH